MMGPSGIVGPAEKELNELLVDEVFPGLNKYISGKLKDKLKKEAEKRVLERSIEEGEKRLREQLSH